MKSGKFSIIFMNDDGSARRLRIGKGLFSFVIVLLFLLPALGGLGIWAGWEAWTDRIVWENEQRQLRTACDEARLQVERLSNMLALAGVAPEDRPAAAATSHAVAPAGAAANATLSASNVADNATLPATGIAANATIPSPAVEEVADPGMNEETNMDTGVVRVENVVARVQGKDKLRLSLDLYNAQPNAGPVGGRITFSLIDSHGKIHPLPHDDTQYRITRFKKVVTTAELPEVGALNSALLVSVTSDDTPVLRKIFSIESR